MSARSLVGSREVAEALRTGPAIVYLSGNARELRSRAVFNELVDALEHASPRLPAFVAAESEAVLSASLDEVELVSPVGTGVIL